MKIVRMTAVHVAQIAQLETLCFSAPWSQRAITSELDNPLSLWLVAVDGDALLGYVGAQSVLDQADMMNLAVAPRFRRQGIARCLVEQLITELRKKAVFSLSLEVRVSNAPAIALYRQLGFVQAGRRPNYYRAPREDALILRKEWDV